MGAQAGSRAAANGSAIGSRLLPIGSQTVTSKPDTVGKEGFSLKVSRRDTSGEVALISIRGGAHLIFPSRQKLRRCLPNHRTEVDDYMSLVTTMGCDVNVDRENARPHLPLDRDFDDVLGKVDELARCFEALAG